MKLKKLILPLISGCLLCSCSAVYEDDNLCHQGAEVRLAFRNNTQHTDLFDSEVHCAKVLLYDSHGDFYGEYGYNPGAPLDIDLPEGTYKALAFGGMSCSQADFVFLNDINAPHHFSEILTSLKPSRALESSKQLHPLFHGISEFTVALEDMDYVPVAIDLTKNTNRFRVMLRYSDGSEISPDDFSFSITADNAVADYQNNVVPQGEEVAYAPYDTGTASDSRSQTVTSAWADLSLAKLSASGKVLLTVTSTANGQKAVDIELIEYLDKIRNLDMGSVSLQEYLDLQDSWTLEFTLEPESDRFTGLTFKINNWEVIVNSFDL